MTDHCFTSPCLLYWCLGLGGLLLLFLLWLALCTRLCLLQRRVMRMERSQAHLQEHELHYASLQRLPGPGSSDLVHRNRQEKEEDASTDYACIAEKKPT